VKCPKCDADNRPDSKYCRECATSLTPVDDIQPSFTKTLETPIEALTRGTLFADRYEALHKESPDEIGILGFLGVLAARRGDKQEALRISSLLENIDRPYLFGVHTFWRARIASLLGDKENAVRLIREALAQGRSYTVFHPMMDFEPLQDYPPFKELIKPKG
jgi:hypothetical protein